MMRVIIIEDTVYRISEKEFKKIKQLENKIQENATDYKKQYQCEDELNNYLDNNKPKYQLVGVVDFDCRR